MSASGPVESVEYGLVEVVLQSQVLCDKDCLSVLLDHMKVISWVYSTLKENATFKMGSECRARFRSTWYSRICRVLEEFRDKSSRTLERNSLTSRCLLDGGHFVASCTGGGRKGVVGVEGVVQRKARVAPRRRHELTTRLPRDR